MMFAQRWNHLKMHFSELISIIKRHMIVIWLLIARQSFWRTLLCHCPSNDNEGFGLSSPSHFLFLTIYLFVILLYLVVDIIYRYPPISPSPNPCPTQAFTTLFSVSTGYVYMYMSSLINLFRFPSHPTFLSEIRQSVPCLPLMFDRKLTLARWGKDKSGSMAPSQTEKDSQRTQTHSFGFTDTSDCPPSSPCTDMELPTPAEKKHGAFTSLHTTSFGTSWT